MRATFSDDARAFNRAAAYLRRLAATRPHLAIRVACRTAAGLLEHRATALLEVAALSRRGSTGTVTSVDSPRISLAS